MSSDPGSEAGTEAPNAPLRRPSTSFRSFPPGLQRFFVATIINMFGSGMVFAFVFIYFDEVRGFSSRDAGLAIAITPLVLVICTPYAGSLSDRFGPRRMLMAGAAVSIVSSLAYGWTSTFASALIVGAVVGVANGLWFPSQSALLTVITPPEMRPAASAFQRTALNIGAALGAAAGGFVVDVNSLRSFQVLFAINAITFVVFVLCLPGMPSGRIERTAENSHLHDAGFRIVLRDRFFLLLLASDLGVALSFGFLWAVTPAYAKKLGVGEATIGVVFSIGAFAVAVLQIPILRVVRGRSRMWCLAVMNLTFMAALIANGLTQNLSLARAVIVLAAAQAVGGIGESILGAIRNPLTSDLAPQPLVGRYFGLAGMVFHGSMGASTAIGGVLMGHSFTLLWTVAAAVAFYGFVTSALLNRSIPAAVKFSP